MKQIIALLLLAPAVASAQVSLKCIPSPPGQLCGTLPPLTSGTMRVVDVSTIGGVGSADWTASGPGYTTTADSEFVPGVGLGSPMPYSGGAHGVSINFSDDTNSNLIMALTINGVGWGYVPFSQTYAAAAFSAEAAGPITHPGTYSASFNLQSIFNGTPLDEISDGTCYPPLPRARSGRLSAVVRA